MGLWYSSFPELSPSQIDTEYDYIIVGGGTAGCVLASRLSEDLNVKVLLLERGHLEDTFATRTPLLVADYAANGHFSRTWLSQPITGILNRAVDIAAGHVLGGASRFNAMLYTRGQPAQYNAWSDDGRSGWGYADLEPYFKKSEGAIGQPEREHRGVNGPWSTRSYNKFYFGCSEQSISACETLGIPYTDDVNDPNCPTTVCAKMDVTLNANGTRSHVVSAFLPRKIVNARKAHLHVCTNASASRLDIEVSGDTRRAVGVYLQEASGTSESKTFHAKARREVIMCGGAFSTPQILMLSGIGPAEHLKDCGIPIVHDIPGVGNHLQDHLMSNVTHMAPPSDSLRILMTSLFRAFIEFLYYILFGTGLFTYPCVQISVFANSESLEASSSENTSHTSVANITPDIELMGIAFSTGHPPEEYKNKDFFTFMCVILRPLSTGTVRLASRDPRISPLIDLNFLSDPKDIVTARKAIRLALRLSEEMQQAKYLSTPIFTPKSHSDADIDQYVREGIRSSFHYSSSCRMAPWDQGGVVDDELRVWGMDGLRIADASIFPDIIATHLQAPVVMVAEKCADMIKQTWARHP